jgi:integrase/recombinase XerC
MDEFLNYLQYQKRSSKHTVTSYQLDLTQFQTYLSEQEATSDINHATFKQARRFLAHLMESHQTARTINRKLSALKSYYKYQLRNGEITVSPVQKLKGPKIAKRLPEFVDESAMNRLMTIHPFEEDFNGQRDKLLLDILYQTGIRRSELIQLTENDLDLHNSEIKVLGKRNKERIIPFYLDLKRNLEAYLKVKRELNLTNSSLFVNGKNKSLNEQFVYRLVKKYLGAVTTLKKKSPHILRHTFATHMLNDGSNINAVKELLGHANLTATQVYTHNTIDKLKTQYKQAHPRSGE